LVARTCGTADVVAVGVRHVSVDDAATPSYPPAAADIMLRGTKIVPTQHLMTLVSRRQHKEGEDVHPSLPTGSGLATGVEVEANLTETIDDTPPTLRLLGCGQIHGMILQTHLFDREVRNRHL
jgi:hypothetical protein